jgi:hypothetical protein
LRIKRGRKERSYLVYLNCNKPKDHGRSRGKREDRGRLSHYSEATKL